MRFRFGMDQRCHGPMGLGRGGRPFGAHGPRNRPRMFEQGDLRFVVLKLLADKPAHGYEIIKAIEDRFGGGYAPSPGIVYPTLTLLEEQGFIAVVGTDGPRKLYGLTDEGRAELARSEAEVERVFARIGEMRQRFGGAPAPELMRAMENLKAALRLRMSRGAVDVSKLTAILDGAARHVETS